ncbi:cysteine and tyrosine-rich protein 1-like [Physella acuta]|uniref:cysteine and tyrosine-rich protein 1-like n=1 Tax=Physella acuta TaxID=109671 RepID=UPI0027DDDA37|nr:cysteine and tyrosine-rich protein 1-like [Physella acuta]
MSLDEMMAIYLYVGIVLSAAITGTDAYNRYSSYSYCCSDLSPYTIAGIVLGCITVVCCIASAIFFLCRYKQQRARVMALQSQQRVVTVNNKTSYPMTTYTTYPAPPPAYYSSGPIQPPPAYQPVSPAMSPPPAYFPTAVPPTSYSQANNNPFAKAAAQATS